MRPMILRPPMSPTVRLTGTIGAIALTRAIALLLLVFVWQWPRRPLRAQSPECSRLPEGTLLALDTEGAEVSVGTSAGSPSLCCLTQAPMKVLLQEMVIGFKHLAGVRLFGHRRHNASSATVEPRTVGRRVQYA
jgi:hypothetical protein